MTQISKKLAAVLPLSKEERIISTGRLEDGRWALASSQEKLYVAKKVISTAPQPQSLELFSPHLTADELLELGDVRFEPCLSLILLYPFEQSPDWSGIFWNHGKIISWVAHDSSKRKDPQYCCLVVQCQPDFSEKYFESDPQKILKKVLFELHVAFGDQFQKPIEYHCKTWKYSRCSNPLGKNYFVNYDESLFMTGDWCLGNKVESAFTSANALSEYAVFKGKTPKLKI
jgi:predicted NAD/FAD-dependent oxidoreductase